MKSAIHKLSNDKIQLTVESKELTQAEEPKTFPISSHQKMTDNADILRGPTRRQSVDSVS